MLASRTGRVSTDGVNKFERESTIAQREGLRQLIVLQILELARATLIITSADASHEQEVINLPTDKKRGYINANVGDDIVFFEAEGAYVDIWKKGYRWLKDPSFEEEVPAQGSVERGIWRQESF